MKKSQLTLFTWILFLLSFLNINAQTSVSGTIVDKKNGKPLPYATIYFEGKRIGTKSDADGNFRLFSPQSETIIYGSFLGFKTDGFKIKPNENNTITIRIGEESKRSKLKAEVRSTRKLAKDTLAVRIMRNVIRNKDNNKPSAYNSIQYRKHNKFEADIANIDSIQGASFVTKPLKYILEYQSETPDGERYSPILFRETFLKEYRKGKKLKKIVSGVKDTKIFDNESIYSLLEYAFDDYNIYDNQVIIANKPLPSPVADLALIIYRYYVDDSSVVDGKKNYLLSFAPVSKNDFGFTGKLMVEEGSWAIKEVLLGIDKRANINWVNHLELKQTFSKVGPRYIVTRDEKDIALAVSKKSKTAYKARFRQIELIDSIQIDNPIDDLFFEGEETDYLPNYRKIDDNFVAQNRLESLSAFEEGIYDRADSFRRTRQYQTLKYWTRVVTSAFFPIPPINMEVGRLYQLVSWNAYEGYRIRLGARTMFDNFKNQNLSLYTAYGTEDRQFKYGVEYFYNFPKVNRRWNQLYFSASHDYQRLGESDNLLYFDNIVQSLFRTKENRIRDIILKDDVKFVWTKEWQRGLQTSIGGNRSRFYANSFYPFLLRNEDGTTKELEYIGTTKFLASLRFAPKEPVFENEFYRRRMKSIRPVITVSAQVGVKGLWESDYSYMRFNTEFKQIVPLIIGNLNYNLQAGSILGTVPYIDLVQHGGNRSFLNDEMRYMLMNEGEFVSDAYVQLWVNHNFNGFFLNKIPLLKALGWREFVFAKALTGSINQRNLNYIQLPGTIESPGALYSEAGFGLKNIFKVLEVHFVWRLTQLDKAESRPFGVLFGASVDL